MSSLDVSMADADLVPVLPGGRWERVEGLLARLSDRLNPILIKEARQALRSRQFTMTFFMMLAAGWAWSILGLAMIGPAAYYGAEGPTMFFVYYVILAAPLLVAAPYFAYHSLAAERQDRTFELVSITSLNARQILTGKLCGISLQMMVYLSALFPCLAFTYLLRGLDILTVLLVVLYTCMFSLGLSMIGLLLAAMSPSRGRQIIQGVIFAALLVYVFGLDVALMSELIGDFGIPYDDSEFWLANMAWATLYVNGFALVFLCARTQLTTACQNRSTALRMALVVSQLSMLAWCTWCVLEWGFDEIGAMFVIGSTLLWYGAGVMMTGESQILSPRVKRELPQTPLGRTFLTWFAPGPGTGYVFAICGMLLVTLVTLLADTRVFYELVIANSQAVQNGNLRWQGSQNAWQMALVSTGYLSIYLGLGKLLLGWLRRFDEIRIALRMLVHLLLILVGAAAPWVIQLSNPQTRDMGYSLLQVSNPFWSLAHIADNRNQNFIESLCVIVPFAGMLVFLANLPSLWNELRQVRVAQPPRVIEEEAELMAAAHADERSSPWDE